MCWSGEGLGKWTRILLLDNRRESLSTIRYHLKRAMMSNCLRLCRVEPFRSSNNSGVQVACTGRRDVVPIVTPPNKHQGLAFCRGLTLDTLHLKCEIDASLKTVSLNALMVDPVVPYSYSKNSPPAFFPACSDSMTLAL